MIEQSENIILVEFIPLLHKKLASE